MALNKRQKKAIKRIAIAAGIYFFLFVGSCGSDNGKMESAMAKVRDEVADARAKIKKEMEKPFILRLFGSIFGQENNTFANMKVRLPKLLKDAMPDFLSQETDADQPSKTACEGMKLPDALIYLQKGRVVISSIEWHFDDNVMDDKYIYGPGQIIEVKELNPQEVSLLIQVQHEFTTEDGIGTDQQTQSENMAKLQASVAEFKSETIYFNTWIDKLPKDKRTEALAAGVALVELSGKTVQWRVLTHWPKLRKTLATAATDPESP